MISEFVSSLDQVNETQWQALWDCDYPFIQYGFLSALEQSDCVNAKTGWQPHHYLLWSQDRSVLLAAMPLYIKAHSFGEYVFDWAWADAYERYGRDYYPKLVASIPFTPATGPRLGIASGQDREAISTQLHQALLDETKRLKASSCHILFPNEKDLKQLSADTELLHREAVQFHWQNESYRDFDHFLEGFKSRKRKSLRAERRKVREQGVELICREGQDISAEQWELFYQFYHRTYFKRSGRQGYLNLDFFQRLARQCSQNLMMVQAFHEENMVAGALYFKDSLCLYGRYWGCLEEFDALHFEACYYQGIEYAIAKKLQRFDPGAQGEHKIQRGFRPSFVHSLHWIEDREFRPAIANFLTKEQVQIQGYYEDACRYLPFKEGE